MLVVDDERALAQALRVVLDDQHDVAWAGFASSAQAAMEVAESGGLDVVVIDHQLPEADGLDLIEALLGRHPDLRIVILTDTDALSKAALERSRALGVGAVVSKSTSLREVLDAVYGAGEDRDHMTIDSAIVEAVEERTRSSDSAAAERNRVVEQLTPRELEVLEMLADGHHPKQIARSLDISIHTCRGYIQDMLTKLEVHSTLDAVVEANRLGIIELPTD